MSAVALLHAQKCDVKFEGHIIDFHDNQALDEALVSIPALNLNQLTDENGYFSFENLCHGTYEVLVTHEECDPLQEIVTLNQNQSVSWFLEHHIIQLENIEAKGFQKRAIDTQAETHIHKEEINKNSVETIGYLLKSVSGVSGLETGNNIIKPMIHGMHSSRVIMMNQGVRQEDMEWGVEHAPNMDLNAFEDIRILKGASALRYGGDAIGGIVITELPKLPKKDTLQGIISMTGIANGKGGNLNAAIQKGFNSHWAFQAQASYKKHGDFKSPDYYLNNTGSEQKAFVTELAYGDFKRKISLSYSYFDTDLGIMKASHLGNLSDLADAINAAAPVINEDFSYKIDKPYQNVQHHLAKLKYEKRFQNFGKLEAQYAFQFNKRQEYDVRIGEVTDIPSMDVELTTHSAEAYLSIDNVDHFNLETGVDFNFQHNYSDPKTQNKRLIPDFNKWKTGAFISASYRPDFQWKFYTGVRYDFMHMDTKKYYYKRYWNSMNFDEQYADHIIGDFGNEWLTHFKLDYHNISASLGASFTPNNDSELSVNYAFANRPPNPAELFSEGLHHSAVSIELGDVSLNPEKAHKFTLNYTQNLKLLNGLNFNFMAYHNYIQNYIYQIPSGAEYTIRGAFPVWNFKQIDAEISGVDLDIELNITQALSWNHQLSYVYANDKTNDLALIQMPPFEWNQELSYEWNSKLQPYISFSSQWGAEQKRYADYNFTLNVLENGEAVSKLVDISTPPSSYLLMSLKTGISVNFFNNPLQINGKINNISDTSYRNYLNRFRYYADEMGRQIQLQFIYNF